MLSAPRVSLAGGLIAAVVAVVLSGAATALATTGSSPYFTTLSNQMVTPLTDAAVAPLPNGEVLIAGGFQTGSPQENAELFDPVDDTFTALSANLGGDRQGPVAAPLPDGEVLIAGGNSTITPTYLSSAELFNPATDTFTTLGNGLEVAREYAVAAPLPTGEVLIAGGVNGGGPIQSAELFNPANNTFTALPASGSTELGTMRKSAMAAALPNGQVLIAGGFTGGFSAQTAELYFSAPEVAAAGGDFGDQTVGEPSPASVIVLTNVGAQALSISGASITASADSADFAITADACLGRTLAFEQSCTITARFTPATAATGLTAAIALTDNEPTAGTIALTGNGVAANSGPPGSNGSNGAKGATGATGPRGPAGEVELVTCKSVTTGRGKHKKTTQKCTTKLTSSPVSFKTTGDVTTAVLSRRDVVYATGSAIRSGNRTKLVLTPLHQIRRGTYTLTLTRGRQRQRETITIA